MQRLSRTQPIIIAKCPFTPSRPKRAYLRPLLTGTAFGALFTSLVYLYVEKEPVPTQQVAEAAAPAAVQAPAPVTAATPAAEATPTPVAAPVAEAASTPATPAPVAEAAPQPAPATAAPVVTADAAPANAEALAEEHNAQVFPASVNLRIGSGDTLISLLTDTGVSYEEAHEAVDAMRKIFDPRRLDIGLQVAVDLDPSKEDPASPTIRSLSLPVSKTATVEVKRTVQGFHARKVEAPLVRKLARASAPIRNSFYQTGLAAGIPLSTLNDLIKVYSYDVDFQRDVKRGNKLEVLMERMETENGTVAGAGSVIFASLQLDDRTVSVYRYKDKSGNVDYYNEKGESLRKALLRTPINGARITSGFGMRMHPLLGYSKMHRGVDFGALAGTPIYAAGDGMVEAAGWQGGYGNYVRIKHDAKYSTGYGHASRIAKGIKPGVRVKQGQIIAYVGSTGRSTGPHLHYEVMVNGAQVNPAGIKFKTGNTLSAKELAAFKSQVKQVQAVLNSKGTADKKVAAR